MGYYKMFVPIRMILTSEVPYEIVCGWGTTRYEGVAFHRVNSKYWGATDLYSGTRIHTAKTRKECLDWVLSHRDVIENKRKEPSYLQLCMEFKDILIKAKEELE